jgi:hypothetical protein
MKNQFLCKRIFFHIKYFEHKYKIRKDQQSFSQVNNYDLPDGKIIDFGEDKTMIIEKLFNPVIILVNK